MYYTYYNEYFYNTFPGIQNAENLLTAIPLTNKIYANSSFGDTANIVTPNFDTLYGYGIFDFRNVSSIEIFIPEIKNRYYSLQFIDVWCKNTNYIGIRKQDNKTNYILTNNEKIKHDIFIPGQVTLCIIRVYANYYDQVDIAIAAALITQIQILKPDTPSINDIISKTLVKSKDTPIDSKYYIDRVNLLNKLKKNQFCLHTKDKCSSYNMIGSAFSESQAVIQTALNIPRSGWTPLSASVKLPLEFAIVQWQGLYANDKEEALYYFNKFDQSDNVYDGNNKYRLNFSELPPIKDNGFWSLTCYNLDGYIVLNNADKYTIGTANPPVQIDGIYTIYLQNIAPNNPIKLQNWLPIPLEPCYFILRTYISADLNYAPPPIIIKLL